KLQQKMKRIAQLMILTLTLAVFSGFAPGKAKGIMKIGAKATLTDVKMKATDGLEYDLMGLKKEKGLIVVFSCNTCPFVVGSSNFEGWEKDYNALNELATTNNMGFVLINSNEAKRGDEDSYEAMKKKAAAANYSMPYLVDKESRLADAYGARTTPHVFFFDADMKLVYTGSIDNTWDTKRESDESYLKNAIADVAGGKKVKTDQSEPRGCSIKRVMVEK